MQRTSILGLLVLLAGCGPAYLGPTPQIQQPPGRSSVSPQVAPVRPMPAIPTQQPGSSSAGGLQNVPEVSPNDAFLPPITIPKATYHEARQGETVSGIAKSYGVSVKDLMKANAWASEPQLRAGDQVLIPK